MSNLEKVIRAAEKAIHWSRFVTLLMFGLLLVGLHSVRDWLTLGLLLVGTTAIRAAQIGRDLALAGPMIFYSWPSRGTLWHYSADEATIDRTLPAFIEFLHLLMGVPQLNALNVSAHSMGNRLLHRAVELMDARAQSQAQPLQFGHFILAAPDIDRETFRRTAQTYSRARRDQRRRTTLYWNKSDRAVSLSHSLHSDSRLGTAGASISGTDSILWRNPWFRIDWLGHGYFADAEPVLRDAFCSC